MTAQSFLVIQATSDEQERILEFYREHQVLEKSQAYGALLGAVYKPENADELVVTSMWDDESGYKNWLASGERSAIIADLRGIGLSMESRGWSTDVEPFGALEEAMERGLVSAWPERGHERLVLVERRQEAQRRGD